jgi:predicted transcriptional regulator
MKSKRNKQQKRGRLQTINEILDLSMNGLRKTHIMYKANLSHSQLEKFLNFLIEKGLLEITYDYYITSERGREFLKKFKELQHIIEEEKPIEIMIR